MAPAMNEPAAVYHCFCEHGALLYVGVAGDPQRRLSQHRATKSWWKDVDSVIADIWPRRWQALAAESQAIRDFSPLHNVMGRTRLLYPWDTNEEDGLAGMLVMDRFGGYR